MICFPNAKINLGLRILRKREDGFHDIETFMMPISLCDALEIVPSDEFGISITGHKIEGKPDDNLCVKAYRIIHQRYGIPPVFIHLHKIIPSGAGLGGGSSNAVFTLRLLQRMFKLKICDNELMEMSETLGSDCNFFIKNQPAFCSSRGETIQLYNLNLKNWHLLLIKPPFDISTAAAYAMVTPSGKHLPVHEVSFSDSLSWQNELINDFEAVIVKKYPLMAEIREKLLALGASLVSLSGSGPAMYGLFDEKPEYANDFQGMFVWEEKF